MAAARWQQGARWQIYGNKVAKIWKKGGNKVARWKKGGKKTIRTSSDCLFPNHLLVVGKKTLLVGQVRELVGCCHLRIHLYTLPSTCSDFQIIYILLLYSVGDCLPFGGECNINVKKLWFVILEQM